MVLLRENKFAGEGNVVFGRDFEREGEGWGFLSIVTGDPAFVGEDITLTVKQFT